MAMAQSKGLGCLITVFVLQVCTFVESAQQLDATFLY